MLLKQLRLGILPSIVLLSPLLGCGDASDPDIITRTDLKSPSALKVIDLGNGSVQLRWSTANFEDDFEGYNIYGAVISDSELEALGAPKDEPLQLLDAAGDPVEKAKAVLGAFSYVADNPYALPGTVDNAAAKYNNLEEKKFSALPYHKLRTANGEANLPTCRPVPDTADCKFLGSEKSEVDSDTITSIGVLNFTLEENLPVGEQACFFVFSVQDEAEEISQSSTNIACVVPKYKATAESFTFSPGTNKNFGLLSAIRANCATGTCAPLSPTESSTPINGSDATKSFQFEQYTGTSANIVSGKNAVIVSLGYFASGFTDPDFVELVSVAPALVGFDPANNKQSGGYSQPGQSIAFEPNHIYVVASADPAIAAPTAADFYYDWIYASAVSCDGNSCSATFDMLLSGNPDIRGR